MTSNTVTHNGITGLQKSAVLSVASWPMHDTFLNNINVFAYDMFVQSVSFMGSVYSLGKVYKPKLCV